MAALLDYLPLIAFFAAFKLADIFVATAAMLAVTVAIVAYTWLTQRKVSKLMLTVAGVGLVFGGATLLLHDEHYVKLKTTVVYWLMAAVFLGSQWLGDKPMWQRALDGAFDAPREVWIRANLGWVAFFAALGAVNLWLIHHVDTATWVTLKVWGTLGASLTLLIAQIAYLLKRGTLREEA